MRISATVRAALLAAAALAGAERAAAQARPTGTTSSIETPARPDKNGGDRRSALGSLGGQSKEPEKK